MDTSYRLPDWLGGGEVSIHAFENDGKTVAVEIAGHYHFHCPRIPYEWLVEVKPPSIDDPVDLPLDLPGEVSVSVNAANDYPNPPAETVAALRLIDAEQPGAVSLAFLDGAVARAVARALWKLAGGAS